MSRQRAVSTLMGQPGSLRRRALTSGALNVIAVGLGQAMRLAGNLVLTRLLFPEAFGLMAVVTTVQIGVAMLTDLGLHPAIMRSPNGEDPRFLRTAWTVQVLRSAAVAALVAAIGGLLALVAGAVDLGNSIYADPRLPPLVMASAMLPAIGGFASVNLALAQRRMLIGPVVTTELAGGAIGLVAMIALALAQPYVWALLFGGVVGALARCALSHLVAPGPRMGFLLDRAHAAELWDFGKWLMGASLLGFLAGQGDKLLLGALLGAELFSLYAIARLWIDAAAGAIGQVTSSVGLAALGEVGRERPEALSRAFARFRALYGGLCGAAFLFFVGFGQAFIDALYTAPYAPVGAKLGLLAPMLLAMLYRPFTTLLLSFGDSRVIAQVTAIQAVMLMLTVPLAHSFLGESATLLAVALNGLWGAPMLIRLAARRLPLDPRWEWLGLAALVGAALGVGLLKSMNY